MNFSELENKRLQKIVGGYIETIRPEPSIRPKLDFCFRITNQSIELLEISPRWDDPSRYQEIPFAKATFVKVKKIWKVYWMRADLKWHSYPPKPTTKTIEAFLKLVEQDEHACFFG